MIGKTLSDVKQSFLSFLAEKQFPAFDPICDQKIHRFSRGKGGKNNAWYSAMEFTTTSGRPYLIVNFGDWRTGETYIFKPSEQYPAKESAQIRSACEAMMRAQNAAHEQNRKEAVTKAIAMLEQSEDAVAPYLKSKGFAKPYGSRKLGDICLIPMHKNGSLVGVQQISPDGHKLFLRGQECRGAYFVIGEEPKYLCEGFATGCAIHSATNAGVIVAFNAGNLMAVGEHFKGSRLIVCADDDYATPGNPGLTKAIAVAQALNFKFIKPKFEKNRGTDFDDLMRAEGIATVKAQLTWEENSCKSDRKFITNYTVTFGKDGKPKHIGLPYDQIWKNFEETAGGLFYRLNNRLFTELDGEIFFIDDASNFMVMLMGHGITIEWSDRALHGFSKIDFFNYARSHCTRRDTISYLPHEPRIESLYYATNIIAEANGTLDELVAYFNPASEFDKALIKAMFMTPFWGGAGGARPAFIIDGEDDPNDRDQKRGIGKTTLTDFLVRLTDGKVIDLSTKMLAEAMKQRILGDISAKIVRFDNVKTNNLSSDAIESLITASVISGHQMYVGQTSVPNYFTYVFTFNNAIMSKDMAKRALKISLRRKEYSSEWYVKTLDFVTTNKSKIISDILATLSLPGSDERRATRFPLWEQHVMTKCITSEEARLQIEATQEAIDDETVLREDMTEIIKDNIHKYYRYEGNQQVIFDPSQDTIAICRSEISRWLAPLFTAGTHQRLILKRFDMLKPVQFLPQHKIYRGTTYEIWAGGRERDLTFLPKGAWRLQKTHNAVSMVEWQFDKPSW